MSTTVKNIVAVIAGVALGSIVNMAIIGVGPMLVPPPAGVDMSDMEKLAENLKLLKPVNFIPPLLAHALGTLVGAFIAAKTAASHKLNLALGVGALFLLGGIAMVMMVGGPVWFIALDLIGAYLPMGYLGGMLAGANKTQPASL
jgi:hypothetical protein